MKNDDKKREVSFSEDNHVDIKNKAIMGDYPKEIKAVDLKIMRFVMSQCRKGDAEFFEYEFSVADIAKFINADQHNLYKEAAKRAVEQRLFNCNLKVWEGEKDWGNDEEYDLIHLFKRCKYRNGVFTMKMDDEAKELLLNLSVKGNFTEIPIAPILEMKRKNSIRIYEMICSKFMSYFPYADKCTSVKLSLDELRQVTDREETKSYEKAGHVKERILNPAIKEIEKAANWKIIVRNLKRSRKIIGFELEVWDRFGYAVVERYKQNGELPPRHQEQKQDPDVIPGQMSLFDY